MNHNFILFFILNFKIFTSTGVHIYRIERSPEVGTSASPWVVKRLRARISENQREKQMISSRLLVEANILK